MIAENDIVGLAEAALDWPSEAYHLAQYALEQTAKLEAALDALTTIRAKGCESADGWAGCRALAEVVLPASLPSAPAKTADEAVDPNNCGPWKITVSGEWEPVGEGTPLNAILETKREGEDGTNLCFCRLMCIGDEPEWIEKPHDGHAGRTTVTHHSFAAPTHWRWPQPKIHHRKPKRKD